MSPAGLEGADRPEDGPESRTFHCEACCAPHGAADGGSASSTKQHHGESSAHVQGCPACGQRGQVVPLVTVRNLVLASRASRVLDGAYRFCTTPSCDVVYYDTAPGRLLRKGDVRIRVGLKETVDPITICYCFGHTRSSIRKEIVATGRSTVQARVTAEVKAGRCACEIENPSGRCCLGDVARAVRMIRAELARTRETGGLEDPGNAPCDCG